MTSAQRITPAKRPTRTLEVVPGAAREHATMPTIAIRPGNFSREVSAGSGSQKEAQSEATELWLP